MKRLFSEFLQNLIIEPSKTSILLNSSKLNAKLTNRCQVSHHRLGSCPSNAQGRVGIPLRRWRGLNHRPTLKLPGQGGRVLTGLRVCGGRRWTGIRRVIPGRRKRYRDDGQGDEVTGFPDQVDDFLVTSLTNVLTVDLKKNYISFCLLMERQLWFEVKAEAYVIGVLVLPKLSIVVMVR